MTDEQRLLASAILDGMATSDEMARGATDPEVQAELSRLRTVRAELAAVEAVSEARRDSILAAALASIEAPAGDVSDTHDDPVAPAPASMVARRRARWLMPAAAAVIALVAVGGIVAIGDGRGDDDASSDLDRSPGGASVERAAEATISATADSVALASAPADTAAAAAADGEGDTGEDAGATTMIAADELAGLLLVESPADLVAYAADPAAFPPAAEPESPDGTDGTDTSTGRGTTGGGANVPARASVASCPAPSGAPKFVGTVQYGEAGVVVDVFTDVTGTDLGTVVALDVADCAEHLRTVVD